MTKTRLVRFLFLSAINCQITVIVAESWLFRGFRVWAYRRSEWLGRLVSCDLCFGTWVGFLLALVFRPAFVEVPPTRTPWRTFDVLLQRGPEIAGDALAIALGGRAINEVLGLLSHEVEVIEEERDLLAEEIHQLAPATPHGSSNALDGPGGFPAGEG
jgi:hypothetical protein